MSLNDITREAVLSAIADYDQLGQDEFLDRYGFDPARSYRLIYDGKSYDSKAVVGVAHGFLPGERPLAAREFSGGEATVGRLLRRVGFTVEVEETDPLAKLTDLHRNRISGSAALHKPLLLLLALGRLEQRGSSELPWSVAEVELADLITRFTPPARTGAAQRAAYPFTRLRTDGIWVLDHDVAMDSVRELNAGNVTGRLVPEFEAAFRDRPDLIHRAARLLLQDNFSADVAPDVLTAVGLDASAILAKGPRRPDIQHTDDPQRRCRRGEYQLADYVNPTISEARPQFRALLERQPVASGRQVAFLPVETLLCLAASFVVNHRNFGGATADRAPEPVPSLARLFSRRPSSILAKMANLDDSRPNGARWDAAAGAALRDQPMLFTHVYRVLMRAARAEGIESDRLPDFLELEHGGEFQLLGQQELGPPELDELRREMREKDGGEPDSETERIMLAVVRAGQHLFAVNVLRNCGDQCVFCGLRPSTFGGRRMLIAGHVKPWRDSTPRERLDVRNGLAACPAHDVAFDTGLITVDADMHIILAKSLAAATRMDPMTKHFYGQPPMLDRIQLPPRAHPPRPEYLAWHRKHVFLGGQI